MTSTNRTGQARSPRLSICIATFRRRDFLAETLESICDQLGDDVELVIVEGASDNPATDVVEAFQGRCRHRRYFLESMNSGVDADYDRAVSYACGQYCWLMTDDDLVVPGAVSRVLAELDGDPDLVIVDASVRTADFSRLLHPSRLRVKTSGVYGDEKAFQLFTDIADGISFIGSVVIRRLTWIARDREKYYGSLFVHVGAIFQSPPVWRAKVVAEPLIVIRYGNAMWSERGFEIWMFKWPALIWSFEHFPDRLKKQVCLREPWRRGSQLALYRAVGGYGLSEYRRFLSTRARGGVRILAFLIAVIPARAINVLLSLYVYLFRRRATSGAYDLARSRHSTWLSRALMKRVLG